MSSGLVIRLWAVATIMAIAAIGSKASAQDRTVCLQRNGQDSIEACSRVIASNELIGQELATVFVVRATLFRAAGAYDQAISDMTRSIELLKGTAPSSIVASAYTTRASFYALSGDLQKSLADYQQALGLDPTNAQAAEGAKNAQSQLASISPGAPDAHTTLQIAPPNEPLPADISIPPDVLQLIQSHPFFANAPPVRIGGYSYQTQNTNAVNGFHGGTSASYNTVVKWLRSGVISEQTLSESETVYNTLVRMKSETRYLGAANGLISLGYRSSGTTYVTNSKPMSYVSTSTLRRIGSLQGVIFPIRVGNRFSYELMFQTVTSHAPDDEWTEIEQCEFTQKFDARSFHPDLTGFAYLEVCQDQQKYKRNKAADRIGQSRTLYFEDLGVPIRVDPQSPPQRIIQTYFQNETNETARLQSFVTAR